MFRVPFDGGFIGITLGIWGSVCQGSGCRDSNVPRSGMWGYLFQLLPIHALGLQGSGFS